MYVTKDKIVTLSECYKKVFHAGPKHFDKLKGSKIGPKHFDKLEPEPQTTE